MTRMTQDEMKRSAAAAALEYVEPGRVIGVGTGSTAGHFIDALAGSGRRVEAAVASSIATAERLRSAGIRVVELDDAGELPVYVDGADEATRQGWLIKGGGGALTREKIIAAASRVFVCIVDESKLVGKLGAFPLPIEVIPMAQGLVARELTRMGGRPAPREAFTTDNGNCILDVTGLDMGDPPALESVLNQLTGVVSVGLFCRRPADVILAGAASGVEAIRV